jgi:large repetitive protein
VNTVTLVDGRIYVGGSFLQIDGENRERLAELAPAATASGNAGGPYPNSSPALPGTVTGSANTAVSAEIAGLIPETSYYYRVVTTNGGGTVRSIEGSFTTMIVVAGTAPQTTNVPATKIGVGREYSYTVTASGSPAPSFQLDSSPPAGMVLDATTGVIRWTTATVGSYPVTVRAANGVLPEATQTFTIVVRYEVAVVV